MTYGTVDFVGREVQQLPLGKTIGDAFRSLVVRRFPHHGPKALERAYGYDPSTAKNIIHRGCVSERSLTKAARAEGWAFWLALGEELFGQSYTDWEEQRLQSIIERAEHELDRVRRLRPATAPVSERALDRDAADHLDSDTAHERAVGGARRAAGGRSFARAESRAPP